jgi:hypothetical protein
MTKKKIKRGRPLASPEIRDQIFQLRLNETELQSLATFSWRYDKSMSEVVRDALMILSVIPES